IFGKPLGADFVTALMFRDLNDFDGTPVSVSRRSSELTGPAEGLNALFATSEDRTVTVDFGVGDPNEPAMNWIHVITTVKLSAKTQEANGDWRGIAEVIDLVGAT